jgi:hypothetical protein
MKPCTVLELLINRAKIIQASIMQSHRSPSYSIHYRPDLAERVTTV